MIAKMIARTPARGKSVHVVLPSSMQSEVVGGAYREIWRRPNTIS